MNHSLNVSLSQTLRTSHHDLRCLVLNRTELCLHQRHMRLRLLRFHRTNLSLLKRLLRTLLHRNSTLRLTPHHLSRRLFNSLSHWLSLRLRNLLWLRLLSSLFLTFPLGLSYRLALLSRRLLLRFWLLREIFPAGSRLRVSLLPLPEWRLDSPIRFFVPDIFFKSHPISINVDLKIELVILRKISLKLMPTHVLSLKRLHQLRSVNRKVTQLVVLVALPLDQPQIKLDLPTLDHRWHVKVQPARSNRQRVNSIDLGELSTDRYPILVELLRT